MPELPEVETVARSVHARVGGDRIVEAWFASYRELFKTPAARQARGLDGSVVWSGVDLEDRRRLFLSLRD